MWISIVLRESVIYLDSSGICAKGEMFDTRPVLHRCRYATFQEDNDRAINFRPGGITDSANVLAGHTVNTLRCDQLAYRNST